MVLLVTLLDIVENVNSLIDGGRINKHLLKPAFQRAVFLNMLAVFIEGGGADALDLSAGQSRL